jgi:uncharacterized protein YyaL (SSP411 family)
MKGFYLLLLLTVFAPALAVQNQLRGHASPYLAMHGADPVAWQDWGPEAVERARREGKLLFVSSGYFSCHWCHVMQRESYRNEQVAALLNTHFIPVKLDRELHGALDAHLIDFVEKTQGQAGWPLNVFLTPEGYPLVGATYLPVERFQELLERLSASWSEDHEKLRNLARRTALQLMLRAARPDVEALDAQGLYTALLNQTVTVADAMEGGFGNQNRFPMAPQLMALLGLQAAAPQPELAEFLLLTLDKMAAEGLRDQLAGGFFRYTVDPSWQVPHFEKMLYTQAQLSEVYLSAAQLFGREDYAEVARDTLYFVMREMASEQGGGYVASFSAVDGGGEEGGVYLWSIDELHALLGERDTALARRHWRLLDIPALDGGHLPLRGEGPAQIAQLTDQPEEAVRERLEAIRSILLVARGERILPVDGKVLAGWNGLLLAAMARAAREWQDPDLSRAATGIRNYLRDRLWDGSELRRAVAAGQPLGRASMDDYAYVAYGMAHYAELSGEPTDKTFVAVLLNAAWQRFYGPDGWRRDDRPLIPGIAAEAAMPEGALPAPSGLLIRLALHSDDPELVARAVAAAELARPRAQDEPFWYSGHHAALLALSGVKDGSAQ